MNNDSKIFITNMETGEMTEFATGGIATVPLVTSTDRTDYTLPVNFPTCGTITGTVTITASIYKNIFRVRELKEKLFWAVVEQKLKHPRKKPRKINRIKRQIEKLSGWWDK